MAAFAISLSLVFASATAQAQSKSKTKPPITDPGTQFKPEANPITDPGTQAKQDVSPIAGTQAARDSKLSIAPASADMKGRKDITDPGTAAPIKK
jgi:hypothetical protein